MAGKCKTQACRDRQARKASRQSSPERARRVVNAAVHRGASKAERAMTRGAGGAERHCVVEYWGGRVTHVISCHGSKAEAKAKSENVFSDGDYVGVISTRDEAGLRRRAAMSYRRLENEA